MPITIDFLSNVRDFLRGTKNVEESLDDVADSLDDVARDSDQAMGKIERGFRDMARQARDAQDDVKKVGDKGFNRAGEAATEFKSEALSNFSEVTSSFDGSMSSIGDLAQGTLGGLASSLPGIGLIAGGAAVGVGLITAALDQAEERRAQLQERANDLANAYIEAGSNVLSAMGIASRTSEILTGDERKEAEDYARVLGVDIPTAARAMAGDLNALALVTAIATEAERENEAALNGKTDALSKARAGSSETAQENQNQIDKVRELTGVVDGANQKFEEQQAVLLGLVRDAGTASEEVDEVGNRLYTLPDTTQVLIDAETGQATTDVSKFRGDLDEKVPTVKTTTIKFTADMSALDTSFRRIQERAAAGFPTRVYPDRMFWE